MELPEVEARVRYLNDSWKDADELPRINTGDERRAVTSYRDVRIADARPLHEQGALDLEGSGFILARHQTAVTDFFDEQQVEVVYYPEMETVVKTLSGADAAFPIDHIVRSERPSESFVTNYARFMHLDFSEVSVSKAKRYKLVKSGFCDASEAEGYDVAMFNTWQPFDRDVETNPLTLIDARSLREDDLVDFVIEGGDGRVVMCNPEHRLYYVSRMRPDELLVFKQDDTRPGHARFCPHTSFDDPRSPVDAPKRRSIEIRWLAAFRRSS